VPCSGYIWTQLCALQRYLNTIVWCAIAIPQHISVCHNEDSLTQFHDSQYKYLSERSYVYARCTVLLINFSLYCGSRGSLRDSRLYGWVAWLLLHAAEPRMPLFCLSFSTFLFVLSPRWWQGFECVCMLPALRLSHVCFVSSLLEYVFLFNLCLWWASLWSETSVTAKTPTASI